MNVIDLIKELPDETIVNKAVLPDEIANDTSVCYLTQQTHVVLRISRHQKQTVSSSDVYPNTTISAQALPETTDSTSGVLPTESAADTILNSGKIQQKSEQPITGNVLNEEKVLPDETELETSKCTLPDETVENGSMLPGETNLENRKCTRPDATTHERTNE